jgi:membrane-associated phospholipid phosphatase
MGDNFFAPWSGTVPVGPGLWFSTTTPPTPPGGVLFGKAKTYFLLSGDQFRPPPPPAFGSPEFLAALAEVRQISDTRTPEQDAIAKFWAMPVGTYAPSGYWNEQAALLAVQYHLDERRIAHALALMNMVGFDAIVASHDAKFTYWFIRPTQADPGITLAVALPNFPSYSSNHAALSGGMARILAAIFPAEAARLDALADQAAMSRLYAGIHYRFDDDAGLLLGRTIAAFALSLDVNGHESFVLR